MKEYTQPDGVVRRLPKYYRYLSDLKQMGIARVSSKDLSKRIGNTPSQVRQDFNCFGGFGQQGYGYDVETLYNAIGNILGLNTCYTMVIIGAGRLGQALANYTYFEKKGFQLTGIFDVRSSLVGKQIRGVDIRHIDELSQFAKDNPVDIVVLAVPKEQTNEVADLAAGLGIKGIWNFAPAELSVDEQILVENIQLSDSLMTLGYRIKEAEDNQNS